MTETTFTWLHLSDLHVGMAGGLGRTLWDTFEERLYDDLSIQLKKVPPLDVVLFTGDLTQRGTAAEFEAFDRRLERMWEIFRRLGQDPPLMAVPGNHDLQRPAPHEAASIALANWWSDHTPLMRQRWFWEQEGTELRAYIDHIFEPYVAWYANCPYVKKDGYWRSGLLPGDFAQTIEKNGLHLGIVGLNSSFLHLSDAATKGSLALDRRQLAHLVEEGEQFYRWSAAQDFALLLTHHPPSWLHPSAVQEFDEGIYPPDYFDAHLFGHVHEGAGRTTSVGGTQSRRVVQASSLFGLEDYSLFTGARQERQQRIHGYGFGIIRVDVSLGRASLVQRRRRGFRAPDGSLRLAVDNDAMVHDEDTGFTNSEPVEWAPNARASNIPQARALRRPYPNSPRPPVASTTDETAISLLSAWISSSIPEALCRPRQHADIEARLGLEAGASRRLITKTVELHHPSFRVDVNTDTVVCLSLKTA